MLRKLPIGVLVALMVLQDAVQAQCPFAFAANSILGGLKKKSAGEDAWRYANSGEFDPREGAMFYRPNRAEKFLPPSCGLKISPCYVNSPYRNFDGSCNNLEDPTFGVPNATYFRLHSSRYADGLRAPRRANDGSPLPSVRVVRTSLFPTGERPHDRYTLNVMLWGQFLAHDMSLLKEPEFSVPCCSGDGKYTRNGNRFCYPIKIPPGDATMGRAGIECLNFTRTVTDKDMGCSPGDVPAQQINAVTSFMDLSNVYGLNTDMANGLRTFRGGRMRTEVRNGRIFPPTDPNITATCVCSQPGENVCYQTGDSRANQNPQLAILQTIFVREHNRIAGRLADMNWHWGDERIFQETRRILIAVYQKISYYDWLPLLLGRQNMAARQLIFPTIGYVDDYDPGVNPDVGQEHAHAAYRFFHTQIVGNTKMMSGVRSETGSFQLFQHYHRPAIVEKGNNIETMTVGMSTQPSDGTDNIHVEDITDKMFACGKRFGLDLRAADFQRDRDHGLAYYVDYRRFCGLSVPATWDQLRGIISNENIDILRTLYKSVDDLDLSVAGSLEPFVNGAECGPTFLCIMNDQFLRTRQGDRFWFEHSNCGLTPDQLTEIRRATFSRILCDNGDGIRQMQGDAFMVPRGQNSLKNCANIPSMDLTKWKENLFAY